MSQFEFFKGTPADQQLSFYSSVVDGLLEKYFGVNINDTDYSDEREIAFVIAQEIQPYEAVNNWAEDCGAQKLGQGFCFDSDNSVSEAEQQKIIDNLNKSCH